MRYLLSMLILFSVSKLAVSNDQIELNDSGKLIEEGIEFYDKGEFKKAIDNYLRVNRSDTNYLFMLDELAVAYTADSQEQKAVEICLLALQQPSAHRANLFNTLGTAYDHMGEKEKAVKAYKNGLEEFPYDYLLYYNLGLVYYRDKQYNEAFNYTIKALEHYPLHPSSHLLLGYIAFMQGHLTHTIMSWTTLMAILPDGNSNKDILSLLESMAKNTEGYNEEVKIDVFQDNSAFEEMDYLINSGIALNKEYKTKVKIDASIVKQLQLIIEKFKYDAESPDFWMQTYGSYFRDIGKNDLVDAFTYLTIYPAQLTDVNKWIKKNDDRIETLYQHIRNNIGALNKTKIIVEGDQKVEYQSWYIKQDIEAIGNLEQDDPEKKVGNWKFFFSNGVLKSEGKFGNNYLKQGVWKYYNNDNSLTHIIEYTDGELHGKYESYHRNGNLKSEVPYIDGKANGLVTLYYSCGAKSEVLNYKDDLREGKGTTFYYTRAREIEYSFLNDKYDGEITIYYPTGEKKVEMSYKNGEKSGEYKRFHDNGKLSAQGQYKVDKPIGKWEYFYDNGQLETIGALNAEGRNGQWTDYYRNGNIKEEANYENGMHSGLNKFYEDDGILHYQIDYKKGQVTGMEFFDKSGQSLNKASGSGNLNVQGYFPDGSLKFTGSYKNGKENGEWKYYYSNGKIKVTKIFKDGLIDGPYHEYFENGKLSIHYDFEDGESNGYYKSYFINGKTKSEGWVIKSNQQGEWRHYYINGNLKDVYYYLNDEVSGYTTSYTTSGDKRREYYYEDNLLKHEFNYSPAGEIFYQHDIKHGSGELIRNYTNGKTRFKAHLQCGDYHGPVKWYDVKGNVEIEYLFAIGEREGDYKHYHPNGKLRESGKYKNGNRTGKWEWYFDSGKLETAGNYREHQRDSIWSWFHENGKTDILAGYKAGEKNGWSKYYDHTGEFRYQKYYDNGIVSYNFIDASGNFTEPVILKEQTGIVKAFFKNGQPSVEEEYQLGKYAGERILYNSDGKIAEKTPYLESEINGMCMEYYSNGNVKAEEEFYYGYKNGLCKYYHDNGQLKKEENYILGDKYGKASYYNSNGQLEKSVTYWDDIIIKN